MAEPHEIAEFAPIMKTVYLPIRKNAFKTLTPLMALARGAGPENVTYAGHDLAFLVKVGQRGGFVSDPSGFFPESLLSEEKMGRLSIAKMYAKVYIDGFALRATNDPKGSYLSAAKKATEDLMEQWEIEQERQALGDSTGVKALVKSRTSATVVVVDSPGGIASSGPGNLWIREGDTLASLDASASNALLAKAKVLSISLSGDDATITFDATIEGSGTIAVGDLLVSAVPASVSATSTSYGAEWHGLKSIMDVESSFATFEGINDARWVAQKMTSTTVSETVVMRLLNTIRARAGVDWRKNPKQMLLLTTTGIWQTYGETLLGLRRFNAPEMTIEGGFTGVMVAGATLIDDPWMPRGRLYAVHGPDTVFVDLMKFGVLKYQDSPSWRLAATRDGFEQVHGVYANYGVTLRHSHGVISGITDTVNYSPIY